MMLNFLDLSTASEDERRLIREILSETSDVNTSQPTNFPNSNSNNGHATTTSTNINVSPNVPTNTQAAPAAGATTTTTAAVPSSATTTIITTTNTTNSTSNNQFTTSSPNHGPNLPTHRSNNSQYTSINNSQQQRKNIHSGNSINTMGSNSRSRINNNSRSNQVAGGLSNNVQQTQQHQLYYSDAQHYTPTLPSNISSSSTSSHYHNNVNSTNNNSTSGVNNVTNNSVNLMNNHSANALKGQRVNNNEHNNERLRSSMSNHTLQNNNDNNIVVTSSNHLVHTTQSLSMDQHLSQHQHHHQHANTMPLNVYNHHTTHMHHHQVPPPPIVPVTQTSSGVGSSSAKLDPKNNSNHLKNQAYHSPQDTSSTNMQINNTTNNSSTGAQSVPASAQMPQPMPGDMNSVIGMDMTSTQPPGYAMPPHVTAFGPPPHHVYGGPPIFQPYHYLIPHPYNIPPSYMPYVIAPNSVVPPRQQVPPQSSQPPSTSTTTNSYSRSHSRSHPSHHHQQQQQQQHHHHHHHHQQHQQPNHDFSSVSTTNHLQAGQDDVDAQPKDLATTNQGPALKKNISEKESSEPPKITTGVKLAGFNIQSDGRSSQGADKAKKNIETESSSETELPKEYKSNIHEQCTVISEKSNKIVSNIKTNNSSVIKPNNVIKNGTSFATRNKNIVPNARIEKAESQMHKAGPDSGSTAGQPSSKNVRPETVTIDDVKHRDVQPPTATTMGNEMVKLSSDEGFDTQSSLDVSKQSQESSIPTTEQSKSTPESCNKSLLEKREIADSNDIKSGDTNQRSGGAWGSASSKSWADLFKSGNGLLLGSSINGEAEHNNIYDSDNSQEESKTSKSLSNKITETSVKVNNLAISPKEQRSQEAAKRALDKMAPRLAQKINSINLKHSLPFLKPRGFINKGNGCYINATLQALVACPPFYNLMKEIGAIRRENSCTPILDSFAELFLNFPPLDAGKKNKQTSSMQDQKLNINLLQAEAIEPKCIYNVLGQIKSECLKGAQEDAEEFLSSVLNCLHDEMISLSEILQDSNHTNGAQSDIEDSNDDVANDDNLWREVGPKNRSLPIRTAKVIKTPIQEIFGGSLFSIRTAGKDRCGHRSPFFDLQLDISSDNVRSVQDAIKSFTATEVIHDFYCSKTKQKLDAQRRTSLDQLPPILILHLKQFVYTQDHGLKKLIKKIEYPIEFELPENCLHEKNSADKNLRTSRSYKLLAVVYHDGKEAIKGHYLTDVYHIGSSQWIRCDDSNLRVIPSPRIENPDSSRTPYLLFYRRLNTLRAQISNHDNKKKS